TAMAVAGAAASCSLACASRPPRPPRRRGTAPPRAAAEAVEIRVCTNRTCARQGGREVLAALEGLSPPPPRVDVASCGCLGRCGAGPNVGASVPGRGNAVFGHVGTAARAARLLEHLLGAAEFDAAAGLAALALREKAEAALAEGDAAQAEALFTEVRSIAMDAPGGLHLAYGGRCKARLAIGDTAGALADADEATRIAPKFPQTVVKLHGTRCLQWESTTRQRMRLHAPWILTHLFVAPSLSRPAWKSYGRSLSVSAVHH
uniref:Uncharacterized protein n=1 Tax=Aegilops tauschii subsp. strangulata TaxID=200361 RepID=A0A453DEC7_AEGTS